MALERRLFGLGGGGGSKGSGGAVEEGIDTPTERDGQSEGHGGQVWLLIDFFDRRPMTMTERCSSAKYGLTSDLYIGTEIIKRN